MFEFRPTDDVSLVSFGGDMDLTLRVVLKTQSQAAFRAAFNHGSTPVQRHLIAISLNPGELECYLNKPPLPQLDRPKKGPI